MAEKQEIEIYISEEGEVKFHITGIKGIVCEDVARGFEKSVGKIKESNRTSEYYEKETTRLDNKQQT
jgi:hypothetical protein